MTYGGKYSPAVTRARNAARRATERSCTCTPERTCGYCEARIDEAENEAVFPDPEREERHDAA